MVERTYTEPVDVDDPDDLEDLLGVLLGMTRAVERELPGHRVELALHLPNVTLRGESLDELTEEHRALGSPPPRGIEIRASSLEPGSLSVSVTALHEESLRRICVGRVTGSSERDVLGLQRLLERGLKEDGWGRVDRPPQPAAPSPTVIQAAVIDRTPPVDQLARGWRSHLPVFLRDTASELLAALLAAGILAIITVLLSIR